MTDDEDPSGKRKADLRTLILKMAPPVSIQLESKSPWIAQSLATGTTERWCAEIDDNDDPIEVARKFVAGLVRERPNDERDLASLTKLRPLSEEVIQELTVGELSEVARQYLVGSKAHIKSEMDQEATPLDQLRDVLLDTAKARTQHNQEMLNKIKDSTSLKSLFGSSAIADLVKTQNSISAMQDHARGFDIHPAHRIETLTPLPVDTTGYDMLATLRDLAASSNEQSNLLNSQREQQALQSETLADMNTSLVALAEGTAGQAAKAERSARWALIVAAASFVITAGGVVQNYFQSEANIALQARVMASDAASAETTIRLLETSLKQQTATLAQAARSQAKNEADNAELRGLIRELIELQHRQQEASTAEKPVDSPLPQSAAPQAKK